MPRAKSTLNEAVEGGTRDGHQTFFGSLNSYSATSFVTAPPAPQIGDPLHYDAFSQAVASLYVERFS